MALLRAALAGCLLLAVGSVGLAEEEIDKAKLVGTWTFVKTTAKRAPPAGAGIKLEFTRDGKLNVTYTAKGKTSRGTGTYALKGDQLTTAMVIPEKEEDGKTVSKGWKETVTIKELTDKRLVTERQEGGRTARTEFKK